MSEELESLRSPSKLALVVRLYFTFDYGLSLKKPTNFITHHTHLRHAGRDSVKLVLSSSILAADAALLFMLCRLSFLLENSG